MAGSDWLGNYAVVWLLAGVVLLYLARKQAHQAIKGFCRVFYSGLRMASRSLRIAETRLRERNREVLLAAGREQVEKELQREFLRVEATVRRDLQSYPALHRNMSDLIARIDEDYRQATDSPPSPPEWLEAVEAVAKIPARDEGVIGKILKDIQGTLDRHHKESMQEYRKASGERHTLLKRMMPFWRKLTNTVDEVGKTINSLEDRAQVIDAKMHRYEEIVAGSVSAERQLTSSSLTQFFIAGLVVAIAIGGAIINFNLIALPMSEMVGGGSYIGSFRTANVAAMVIILVEMSMGLFLMESLRITHMFPVIGQLDDRMRRRLIWTSFTFLLLLAGVESALALMRDMIAADNAALRQSLAGAEAIAEGTRSVIPTVGQMVLGFILPFALAFVAIPLESFFHALRTLLGMLLAFGVRALAFGSRLLASLFYYSGRALVALYDLCIFPLLWVEARVPERGANKGKTSNKKEVEG